MFELLTPEVGGEGVTPAPPWPPQNRERHCLKLVAILSTDLRQSETMNLPAATCDCELQQAISM